MVILTVTVFSFSVLTRAEMHSTLAFKDGTEKKLLAEAGVERAIMEIMYRNVNRNQTVILEGKEAWRMDGTAYRGDMGNGGYLVRILDESGKIPLNTLTETTAVILKNLLINLTVSPEDADMIVDSILDWKDPDDLHRLHGAESDYYLSLPNPYRARNAGFETLEELILVRGITPEILYGLDKKKGIMHFLTVHSGWAQINVNAAPREVLAALPGMDAAKADQIIEFRRSAEIHSMNDIRHIIGADNPSLESCISFASAGDSLVYTIEAAGYKENEKTSYPVKATVIWQDYNNCYYVYYRSPAEILPWQ